MSNPHRTYYDNGQIEREEYRVSAKHSIRWKTDFHREDAPAYIEWYENGQKEYEAYLAHGKWHRADGPARTWWNEDGTIIAQEFWLDDDEVSVYDVLGDTPEAFAWVMTYE